MGLGILHCYCVIGSTDFGNNLKGIKMVSRLTRVSLALCALTLLEASAEGAVTNHTQVRCWVRVAVPGGNHVEKMITITCNSISHTDTDGAAGCDTSKYDYVKVTEPGPVWPAVYMGVTYTAADNQAYWDWVYDGYGGGGACDWTQNCHGYGFGVGDWPANSHDIIYCMDTGAECWVGSFDEATIADNRFHTVKITMKDCKNSHGTIIETSSEKFRESAVYTQTGNCSFVIIPSGGVNLGKGNGPRKDLTFDLLKKEI